MLTAKEAVGLTGECDRDVRVLLDRVEKRAKEGFGSLSVTVNAFHECTESILRSLGYTVEWNRALLEYTISWGGGEE